MKKKGDLLKEKRGKISLSAQKPDEVPHIEKAKKKALEKSIDEGAAASVSGGLSDSYVTPFALALGATPLQIGYLSSFTGLLSPVAQIFGSKMMEKTSRKTLVLRFVLLQGLMWLPIALLGILSWKGILQNYLVWALIAGYSLLIVFGAIATPAWFSWMGDLVSPNEKGKYFARRNTATGIMGLAAALIAAFILDAFQTKGLALLGFTTLFSLAFFFRFISFYLFKSQYNPKFKLKGDYYFSFIDFIKRYDNFGKFAVYRACLNFSIMIASPFFAVYMLNELGFSYITFMAVVLSGSIFYLVFTPLIGKLSDKYGNLGLLKLSGILFFLTPVLWIFIKTPLLLIFIPQLVSGLANATMIIPETNFIYDSTNPQHRAICHTYKNLLVGIGVFLGSLLGGFLANNHLISSINPFFLVFGLSAFLRLAVSFYFVPRIKEERKVERIPPMKVNLAHPFQTLTTEIGWLRSIFK